jgi:hypothetical protein
MVMEFTKEVNMQNPSEIPLIYTEWDDQRNEASPSPILQVIVSQGVLFLRKLVNASVINNRMWEHTSHETDEDGQAYIYVKPWNKAEHSYGEQVEKCIYHRYDISTAYEIEFYRLVQGQYEILSNVSGNSTLEVAQVLLDHYRAINGIFYELSYAVLDHNRRKVIIFVERSEIA